MNTFATPPYITAYVVRHTSDGPRYLLIRRCCGGHLNGTWQMVTGGTMEGETATQTALREIREETGLVPSKLYSADAVETFYLPSQNKVIFVPVFVAFVEEMNVNLSPDEHDAYEWLPFEEVQERLVWAEQRRIFAQVHERFVLKKPDNILLIPTPSEIKPTVSRTGTYGIALQDEKWLLVKQQKGPHAGKYDLPGGGIEHGETIEEALRREFCEEVGMTFDSIQLMENITATTGSFHQIGLIYLIKGLSPLANLEPEMEYFWVDLDSLLINEMAPFAHQMFPKVKEMRYWLKEPIQ